MCIKWNTCTQFCIYVGCGTVGSCVDMKNPLWLGEGETCLIYNRTSLAQILRKIIFKRFDNHAVVFISGWYKIEGDSLYICYNVWRMAVKLHVSDSRWDDRWWMNSHLTLPNGCRNIWQLCIFQRLVASEFRLEIKLVCMWSLHSKHAKKEQ